MINLLARYVLRRIRDVDPLIAAQLKQSLESFNRRTKRWQTEPPTLSERA